MKATLIKKADGWYNLYQDNIGIGSTHSELQGYKLSKQNCDEIFGVVDVEKLATEVEESLDFREFCSTSFKLGVNKAMELNGDKQFTLDDVRNAIQLARYHSTHNKNGILVCFHEDTDKIIQSLQQPTEIEVEIEMELHPTNHASGLELTGNKLMDVAILENYQPKLDADGCLILKKKEV